MSSFQALAAIKRNLAIEQWGAMADTIDRLCRAIEAGDDSVLPILADALEEAGDARAAGLRDAARVTRKSWARGETGYRPSRDDRPDWARRGWGWWRNIHVADLEECCREVLATGLFDALPGGTIMHDGGWKVYPTRSLAFLALAAALIAQ